MKNVLSLALLATVLSMAPQAAALAGARGDPMRVVRNRNPGEAPYHEGDIDFVRDLDDALDHDRLDWIADHMEFPLAFFGNSRATDVDVSTRADFKRHYHVVFDEKLKALIKRTAQSGEMSFIGGHGMMIGRGNVFFFSPLTYVGDPEKGYKIWEIQQCDRTKVLRC